MAHGPLVYAIIQGSYMLFHALTFAGSPGSCLNRKQEDRVFKRLMRDPANVKLLQ